MAMRQLKEARKQIDDALSHLKDLIFENDNIAIKAKGDVSKRNIAYVHIGDPLDPTNCITLRIERGSGKVWTIEHEHNFMFRTHAPY